MGKIKTLPAMTEKEALVFYLIPEDDFYEDGVDSIIWTDCFVDTVYNKTTGLSRQSIGGILSSLSKKGYIECSSGRDGVIAYTDSCKEVMFNV